MAVRKIKDWWWVDFSSDGVRYRKKSPQNTKLGAQRYESTLRQRLTRGEVITGAKEQEPKAFSVFTREWFETYVVKHNKKPEQVAIESILQNHLLPWFGAHALGEIRSDLVNRYKKAKQDEGLTNKRINSHLAVLRKCLNCAVEWEEIASTPRFSMLRTVSRRLDFLSDQESRQLLSSTADPMRFSFLLVALHTGMRPGELIGLDWSDVDFEHRQIVVQRAVYRGVVRTPKKYRIRRIPMTGAVQEVLRERQRENGFVFTRNDGRPMSQLSAQHLIKQACRETGIRDINLEVLRHTFALSLIAKGVILRRVQQLMGHASIATTEKYAHLAPSDLPDVVFVLETEMA